MQVKITLTDPGFAVLPIQGDLPRQLVGNERLWAWKKGVDGKVILATSNDGRRAHINGHLGESGSTSLELAQRHFQADGDWCLELWVE